MNDVHIPNSTLLEHVAVPLALVSEPSGFGGQLVGDCLIGDLLVVAGRIIGMQPPGQAPSNATCYDLAGRMLLPRLIETHCHLDKCHTVGRLGPVGGDLHAAINAQIRDKTLWTETDLRQRSERGLREFQRSGCAVVRTHIDWDTDLITARQVPIAWSVLGELAVEWADRLLIQRSALMPLDAFAQPELAAIAVQHVAQATGAVLGVFVFDQPNKRRLLETVFELAASYDLALDFHVDEGLSAGLDGLEVIAELVLESGFARPVLCGHACSLSNLDGSQLERTLDRIVRSGISLVSLPTTNLYLQDRQSGTPQRRGITRIRELVAAGVQLAIGSDNVGDAFCPLGAHDPMAALALAALTAHLDPPYGQWLPMVTTTARQALGLAPLPVDQAALNDLLVSEADHTADLVTGALRQPLSAFLAEHTS